MFTASRSIQASCDVMSMCETSTKVFVIEVMGRHAGWIAAAGGLAADADNPIPIVILFPEVEFNQDAFIARVKNRAYNKCRIACSTPPIY